MFIRNPYNYDPGKVTLETGLLCQDEHLTVQDQAEDVNDIVRQFGITGKMPSSVRMPQFGDFTGAGTYQECLQAVKDAQNEFLKLPARIRERFNHNPQEFITFCQDEKNAEEGEKLGIWKLRQPPAEAAKGSPEPISAANSSNAEKSKT